MALRQLFGLTCLTLHLSIPSVGVYGTIHSSGEFHIKLQDPFWNSTDHLSSGVGAAATLSRFATPSSDGILAPQMTPSSDQTLENAGAVVLERPSPFPHRPLQPLQLLPISALGNQATLSAKILLSSSRATLTPTGACSLSSTDRSDYVSGATCGSSTVSALASVSTDDLRVVPLSYATSGRVLASGRNLSSISTWSPPSPIESLASASSAIRTKSSGSAFGGSMNASASHKSIATASGTGESPMLVEFLDSIKNRNESSTRLHPWLRPRPLDVHPVRLPISRLYVGSYPTPGALIEKPPRATATGSDGISSTKINLIPLGAGESSTRRTYLESMNENRTESRRAGRLHAHRPSAGLSLSGFNASTFNRTGHYLGAVTGGQYPTNCSGLITSTAHVVYEMVTSTILVNETLILGPNSTTPLPVFITPPPACQTITAPCEGAYCPSSSGLPLFPPIIGPHPKEPMPEPPINLTPYTLSTYTSTLLVTKKTPAVVQQQSAVGNLFGPSTPTSQAVATKPNSDGHQATGQDSGSSNPDMSTQSDDSSPSDSDSGGQSPEKSTPQQDPTSGNSPSVSSDSQNSDSKKPGAGSSGGQSTGSDDQTASDKDQPNGDASNNGATSNHGSVPGNGNTSGNGDASETGDASSNRGTSNSGNTNTGGGASRNGRITNNGGASSHDNSASNAGASSSGVVSTSGGEESSNGGGISNSGGAPNNGNPSSSEGGVSSNEAASSNREGSSDEGAPESGAGDGVDSHGMQYVPSVVMAGNVPISIASNAVIIGSHTVKAGSPPTTIVANDQSIAVQPSQIVAQGKTILIEAAVTPPANSATIGNVPVVLRPQDVAIGSKTFKHGSSPTSIVYNSQTYRWDASQLVGAGATVVFPSADFTVPRVTAGGQVFSVYPSQLKASGRNIVLPITPKASPFVYKGQTFSVNPSQIIAPDTSITLPPANQATPFVYIDHSLSVDALQFMARSTTIPLSSGSGTVIYNGQVLTIKPSEVIGPSTTIALSAPDDRTASPTAVITGGLTFSIGPSAAVVGSSTYSFIPGKAPATIMTHGEAVLVGSNGVQFGNIRVPIPTITSNFTAITQGDLTFSVAPSEVIVGGHTDNIHSDMTPITTVVDGHTISIGPKGVGLASTTIPLPTPKPSFSMATEGDLIFSVAPSEVVVKGNTYFIASNKAPITTAIDGQTMTIGPKGIHLEGNTVNLPVIQTPIGVTAGGLNFLVGATDAVISGITYAIGSGAPLQTVVVGSQTVEIGSAGVILASTTIAPEQTPTAVTVDGLTFSVGSTDAVINGTTYAIGSGAVAKTVVEESTTMVLGSDGVVLPSTTIRPWSSAGQKRFSSVLWTPSASSAATATGLLTPIATGKEGDKKQAAGVSTRAPDYSTLLCLVLSVLMLVDLTLIQNYTL